MIDAFLITISIIFGLIAAPILAALFLVAVGFSVFGLIDLIDRVARLR